MAEARAARYEIRVLRAFFARPQRFALFRRVRSVVVAFVNVHGGSQTYAPAALRRMRLEA
jgi:hypothetical protein